MGFVYWLPNADGDWSNPADWSGGALPGSGDAVTISTSTLHTITHSNGNDFAARLSVGNDVFDVIGGTLSIAAQASLASGFAMSGGVLNVGTTLAVSDGFTQSGGSLYAGTVSITGTAQLLGGYLGGSTTLQASGTVVLSNYSLGGSAQLVNANTIDQTGNVTLGDGTGIGAAIVNQAGASYQIANPVRIASGGATASFSNAGTLAALTGTGSSTIGVQVTSTGTVSIGAGATLVFDGALTSLSGSVVGAGTLGFGGGTNTIAAGTTLGVAGLTLSGQGTTLALGGSLTLAAGYTQTDGSVLSLQGVTLTISGPAQFQQYNGAPLVTGTGTLATTGTTSLLGGGTPLTLGGSVSWVNSGLVAQNGYLTLGSSLTAAASLTNQAGGVFDIVGANLRIANGSTPTSSLGNAGLLEMTANGGTSYVDVNVASTGSLSVASGDVLVFDSPSTSLSGSVIGAGQVAFAGGTNSIAAGTTISIAAISLYNNGTALTLGSGLSLAGGIATGNASTLTLAGNVSVAGSFNQGSGSTTVLGGNTLTLTGADSFQYVGGTGVLLTRGTTTLAGGNTLGGSVAWRNYGTALQSNSIQVGDTSTVAAGVTNEAGAVFNITSGNVHIYNGSTPISLLTNAGTLEMTANGGTSYVNTNLASSGTLTVAATDSLELDGATNQLSGKLLGAGQLSLAAGVNTLAAGTTLGVAALSMFHDGTQLVLGSSESYTGAYYQGWGSTLALGSFVLTLSGHAEFQQYSGAPLVTGTGTLLTQGTTTLDSGGTPLTIGGGTTWRNTGTILASGALQIGTGATTASLVNSAGAVFDILGVNYAAINNGSTPASSMTNAGLLELGASNAGDTISVNVASTGTISVAAGSNLEFDGATNSVAGTLTGAGQMSFGQGTSTIAAGTTISVGTLALYRSNGNINTSVTTLGTLTLTGGLQVYGTSTLTLGGAMSVASAFNQHDSSTIALGGFTLTLGGAAQFQQYNGAPTVGGSGTLATAGTTTLIGGGTALTVGGTVTWSNTGTVLDSGSVQLGNGPGVAALANAGVFDILANNISVANGSTPYSGVANAGTLEMTANGGTSYVSADLASTGTITVSLGDNLEVDGQANSLAGSLAGVGQLSLGAGSTTLAGGTTITVGTLAVYGSANTTNLALGGNVTVGGTFSVRDGSTVALAGHVLTLAGAAQFQSYYGPPQVSGTGTMVTQGVVTLVGGGTALTVGGSVLWSNTGTVLDSGNLQLGNSSTMAAAFSNGTAGVYDIVAANVSIFNGSTPASTITNAGLLEMTASGGSAVAVVVTNTGTILARGGSLTLSGAIGGTGQLAVSGGGTLGFSGTVAATQTLQFLDAASVASITLPSATAFAATIGGFVQGDTIDLNNVGNATATFAGGTLTFKDNNSGNTVAVLHFSGTSHSFSFAADGHGGTLIGDPPLHGAAAALTQQAYFTNVGAASESVMLGRGLDTLVGGFGYAHADVLDLRAVLAGTAAAQDLGNIGRYLTTRHADGSTGLWFDPSGHGGGSRVALLADVGTTVGQMLAHHALVG